MGTSFNFWAERFREQNNPMDAVRGFLQARKHNLEIPEHVLGWLEQGLRSYAEGDKSLEFYLGLAGSRGKAPPRADERRLRRLASLMKEMWEVQQVFEINVPDAAYLVSERIRSVKNEKGYEASVLERHWYQHEANTYKGGIALVFHGHLDPAELQEEWSERYPDVALQELNLNR